MDYYLDVPASCAKQIDDRALQKLSKEMNVQVELRGYRLHVRANDASKAAGLACGVITSMPKLGTKISAAKADRACDWSSMLSTLTEIHGEPIACSSAICEADIVHAHTMLAKPRDERNLAIHEYALFAWSWLADNTR